MFFHNPYYFWYHPNHLRTHPSLTPSSVSIVLPLRAYVPRCCKCSPLLWNPSKELLFYCKYPYHITSSFPCVITSLCVVCVIQSWPSCLPRWPCTSVPWARHVSCTTGCSGTCSGHRWPRSSTSRRWAGCWTGSARTWTPPTTNCRRRSVPGAPASSGYRPNVYCPILSLCFFRTDSGWWRGLTQTSRRSRLTVEDDPCNAFILGFQLWTHPKLVHSWTIGSNQISKTPTPHHSRKNFSVLSLYFAVLAVVMGGIKATLALHQRLLANVLRLPMAFFDTTPKGRIVARFANDINALDYSIPFNIKQSIPAIFRVRCVAKMVLLFFFCFVGFYFFPGLHICIWDVPRIVERLKPANFVVYSFVAL